ncbi:heme lyase CcmF/NrfE family subunit [Marinicella sp. W31]|uniref:heme lyase CcmF/NrfE family subunit n=1 Tax=Marinicella sp. W31 TaxID=3023713 RepID=UPI0037574CDB
MLAEFGQLLLVSAFVMAVLLSIVPLWGYWRGHDGAMQVARPLAYMTALVLLVSFLILISLFIIKDFSVTYVWRNSNTLLPLRYRISATWGAHEGSILMWVTIQAAWIAAVAYFSRTLTQGQIARVLAVLGIVLTGFLAFVLFTSNPFLRTFPAPLEGVDLNPLLQDFGLIIHPPLLYMGYVGFSVAFALSVAALIGGKIDENWIRWSRRWTNVAWAFLTVGIVLGSWWAYYELGWGGWWFWDPVENASFLPWLAGTALIHVQAVSERKNTFRGWTVLLAIITFSLSILGTFLVRSGVLTSVHSFAADPTRGVFLLILLGLYAGGAFMLYALRVENLRSRDAVNFDSRETMLLVNSVIFFTATLTILLGTLAPIVYQAMGQSLSVGAPYFSISFFLIMVPMVIFLPVGVYLRWHRDHMRQVFIKLLPLLGLSMALTVLLWYIFKPLNLKALAGIFAASWILVTSLGQLKLRLGSLTGGFIGMTVAHLGLAVFLFGVSLTEHTDFEKDILMNPGDVQEYHGYTFEFKGVTNITQENYRANQGEFIIRKNGEQVTTMYPQKRFYPRQQNPMTEAAIDAGWNRDLYISLGEQLNQQGGWSIRIYIKPYIRWMWGGALLMMLGALIAMADNRYKRLEKKQLNQRMREELNLS